MHSILISFAALVVILGLVDTPRAEDMATISQRQKVTMKRLIASGKSVPTGIDVPGATFYETNKAPLSGAYFNHMSSTANGKRFWDLSDRYGGGSVSAGGADGGK